VRFLLINQFYPPDVAPTGQLLHDVARTLVVRGHDVSVLCSRRPYGGGNGTAFAPRETIDGVDVRRVSAFGFGRRSVAGRLADYGSFFAGAAASAVFARPRPDLVVGLTTPPFVGVIPRLASALRGTRHAHWLMDLYPDVMVAHGMLDAGRLGVRALRVLTRQHLRNASLVLSLGPRMNGRVRRAYVNGHARAAWVPLWSQDEAGPAGAEDVARVRAARGWRPGELVLLYSGNIGLGHRIGEFLAAARRLGPSGPCWSFVGGGPRRHEVARFVAENPSAQVQILPYVPRAELRESLSSADVHLVSLSSAWQDLMFPSKVSAAFSVGRPVIFVGPRDNDAAAWIEEAGGGWIVAEDDVDGLLRAVDEARDPEERRRRGAAGLAFAREHFAGATNRARVAELLEGCVT
jgi:glycosyltransferase involved in cell wall biosynthesis